MQPKQSPEQVLQHIDKTVQALNMHSLAQYAFLLKQCGVRQPRIFREFFLP